MVVGYSEVRRYWNVWHAPSNQAYLHDDDGRHEHGSFKNLDIIGEWEDPVVFEVNIAYGDGVFGYFDEEVRITIQGDKKTIEFVEGGE